MAASITRLRPVARQQGDHIPGLLPIAQWIDCVVLVGGAPQSYTLPTDGTNKGTILRITANAGPIYGNFAAAAAVPVANVVGASSFMLRTDTGSALLAAPSPVPATLSLFSPVDTIVTIEAWS